MCGGTIEECMRCTKAECNYTEDKPKPKPKPKPKKRTTAQKRHRREYLTRYRKEHPGANMAACKRYRERHPERYQASKEAWLAKNPEYKKKYYSENREKICAYQRDCRSKNRELFAKRAHDYYLNHQEQRKEAYREYAAKNKKLLAGQGALIVRSRLNNGLSQVQLAARLHISRGTVYSWESNRAPANWGKLATVFPEYEGFTFEKTGGNKDA